MHDPGWAVVVPVKRLAEAKSRLRGAVPDHEALVVAMARDTVQAALDCAAVAQVLAVTGDPTVRAAMAELGAQVIPEPPVAGLNAAVAHGQAAAGTPGRPVAALAGDLPALRSRELARALAAAGRQPVRSFVADRPGAGTTLLAAPPGVALRSQFGTGSAAAHRDSGARALDGAWPSLRHDVDTAPDLSAARGLGLGRHTAALLGASPARSVPLATGHT